MKAVVTDATTHMFLFSMSLCLDKVTVISVTVEETDGRNTHDEEDED